MDLNLPFESPELEFQVKLESLQKSPQQVLQSLLKEVEGRLGSGEPLGAVRQCIDWLKEQKSKDAHHPSLWAYLSHPARVAQNYLICRHHGDIAFVQVALMHNIFELTGLQESDLHGAGFSPSVAEAIRFLTIDRSLEENPDYLTRFYGDIESHSADLSLIRVLDKMDNLMAMKILQDNRYKDAYVALAFEFVSPMAHRLNPSLGQYFDSVCQLARSTRFSPEEFRKYESYIEQSSIGYD